MKYEITYISMIDNYKHSITTFDNPRVALYEYLRVFKKEIFNLQIFKNGKDITEKANKMIEKI